MNPRQQSKLQEQRQEQPQPQQSNSNLREKETREGSQNTTQRHGRGLLTGKSTQTSPNQRFWAASKIIRKAVFCVDNVHPSVTE